uniref:Glyoxylate reductase/hydroxypyruvate reductase n=1 Tax=Gopherus evgoodei TaxID=1825980 RepID=A0A8C4Y1L7_9SAUR
RSRLGTSGGSSQGVSGMEKQELPYDYVEFLKKHFNLITMKEFLENKNSLSEKIKAIYILPNLKVIATSGAGVDHLDLKPISSFGVKVANSPFAVCTATADLGLALMLAFARRLVEGCQIADSPNTEHFAADWLGDEVTGASLDIIGMGSIGYMVDKRAKAFEMKILCHNRIQRKEEEKQAVGAIYCKKIEDLLQQSDFMMLVVKLKPQTDKLFGKKELELMKPTATLINISRVVDQGALVEALQNGVIKAAALDVTYPEPLPRHHPLLKLKNIIVTLHIGCSSTNSHCLMMKNMVESILAALNGLSIPNEVIPQSDLHLAKL